MNHSKKRTVCLCQNDLSLIVKLEQEVLNDMAELKNQYTFYRSCEIDLMRLSIDRLLAGVPMLQSHNVCLIQGGMRLSMTLSADILDKMHELLEEHPELSSDCDLDLMHLAEKSLAEQASKIKGRTFVFRQGGMATTMTTSDNLDAIMKEILKRHPSLDGFQYESIHLAIISLKKIDFLAKKQIASKPSFWARMTSFFKKRH